MIDYMKKFSLAGKVACVTGALGLIGMELIHAFVSSGATTVMLDVNDDKGREKEEQLQTDDHRVHYEHLDVTDLENAPAILAKLAHKYGRIDVWVNSAYPRTSDWGNKVEDLSLTSWRQNVDMHLNAYSWFSKEVAMIMKRQESGSIINLASIYGVVGSDFTVYEGTEMTCPMGYSVIKGGIVNLTRYLASYFGKYNVRVNSVCPGGVFDGQNPVFLENYKKKTPLKRLGTPEEIAAAILFLAGEAASYITGATIMVDGGWTAI